jgi:7-cyano-7-deazaguanine synthase
LDSGVLLWWLKSKGYQPATLRVLFPGARKMEVAAARKLARLSGSKENFEVNLPFVPTPKAEAGCYIPQRNLMYYGMAASLAETIGAIKIFGGHIRHDGKVFKDARLPFLKKISKLAGIPFAFPFIRWDKKDIIQAGSKLGVPFEACWSCSRDVRKHCGRCNSCRERQEGFREAGIEDPLNV